MVANVDPIFLQVTKNPLHSIVNADGATVKQIFTAGADGGAITQLTATSDDTSAVTVVIGINNGLASFIIGEVVIQAGAGTNGTTPAVDLLQAAKIPLVDADGSIVMQANYTLEVNAKVAVTAAKTLTVSGVGGDY